MRHIYHYIFIAILGTALASCTEPTVEGIPTGEISLAARANAIDGMDATTRAASDAKEYRGIYPADAPFKAMVCFSTTLGTYKNNPIVSGDNPTCLPIHTTMEFGLNTPIFPPEHKPTESATAYKLKYPKEGNAYCVGFYLDHKENGNYIHNSENTWKISDDGTVATHPIDGNIDLMFAPEIEGSRGKPFGTQQYHHLQTWLKINVIATSEEAKNNWGDIEYIKVKSKNTVQLYLTKKDINDAVTYDTNGESQPILIVENKRLDTYIKEVGSAFCEPQAVCTLLVKTKNHKAEKEIPISLADTAGNPVTEIKDIRGKLFAITLFFKPFAVVEGVCTLKAWENQDEDLFPNS